MTRTWLAVVFSIGISTPGCGNLTGVAGDNDPADTEDPSSAALATPMRRTSLAQPAAPAKPVTPVATSTIGSLYERDAFRNLLAGENFTATAMCDTSDLLVAHYVAGQNITVHSVSLVDPVVLFTGAATQGWQAIVTGNSAGPPRFVNVTAICLDFAP